MRPSLIDEYGIHFQQHLVDKYGMKLWADEEIEGWIRRNKRSYISYDAFKVPLSLRG